MMRTYEQKDLNPQQIECRNTREEDRNNITPQLERMMEEVSHRTALELVAALNLGNGISDISGIMGKEKNQMPKRIKQRAEIAGQNCWLTGYSQQDILNSFLQLCIKAGVVSSDTNRVMEVQTVRMPLFGDYMDQFIKTFKTNQASLTMENRKRIVRNHIIPKFGSTPINEITTIDLQEWFNDLGASYSKETLLKIKNTMSPAFDAAVEDQLIQRNPLRSKRLIIGGRETVHHKAIPSEKMAVIREAMHTLPDDQRIMLALLAYTGMRFEEVLGLRWEDINWEEHSITIQRAVVHPKRNIPEIKETKTATSTRKIPLLDALASKLIPKKGTGFLLASSKDPTGETPLSYSQARKLFDRIRKRFDIHEYTAHDFRDTCATEWRENGVALDVIARLLGHAKEETTERRYVKYRDKIFDNVREAMDPNVTLCDTPQSVAV